MIWWQKKTLKLQYNKLDILAFGAHPDDVELGCGGTLLSAVAKGKKVGIIDLTRGELGTRGTPEIREKESEEAAKILGVEARENLEFKDGFFLNDKTHQIEVIKVIRKFQPDILLTNAITDRHPDHARASVLVSEAAFMAGLEKIETQLGGEKQAPWRPKVVYHYIQFRNLKPDLIVDISDYHEKKMEAVRAHRSQFYDPKSNDPDTLIASPEFLGFVSSRAMELGMQIGVKYGEGYTVERITGVKDITELI
ncbi:bacillithiol biosynthesis deacetylase BshB1 [Bacteroidales bacterium AH-315-N07]|nr:bacillithiol biosynthesis deacetylase BshB1 [Bacteroidales bacterium AH-315-N07]